MASGAAISGSPWTVTVQPGLFDASNCEVEWGAKDFGATFAGATANAKESRLIAHAVYGLAPMARFAVAGALQNFTVTAKDSHGNLRTQDDHFEVMVEGPAVPTLVRFGKVSTGKYKFGISSTVAGTYVARIFIMGNELPRASPVAFSVFPSVANASATRVSGSGLLGGRAGFVSTFGVQLRDSFDNELLRGCNNAALSCASLNVAVGGTNEGAAVGVVDENSGRYTIRYKPLVSGSWPISVVIAGDDVTRGTMQIECGPTSANRSVVFGVPAVPTSGKPFEFSIQAKDAQGNIFTGHDDKFVVSIQGCLLTSCMLSKSYLGLGLYKIRAHVQSARAHTLVASYDGSPIQVRSV